jgi:hypothetical protein
MDGCMDGWTVCWVDGRKECLIDGWMDSRTDTITDRAIELFCNNLIMPLPL